MASLYNRVSLALDSLEKAWADDDDRDVEEFRDRYPERVEAIDVARAVLNCTDKWAYRATRAMNDGDERRRLVYSQAEYDVLAAMAYELGVPLDD